MLTVSHVAAKADAFVLMGDSVYVDDEIPAGERQCACFAIAADLGAATDGGRFKQPRNVPGQESKCKDFPSFCSRYRSVNNDTH